MLAKIQKEINLGKYFQTSIGRRVKGVSAKKREDTAEIDNKIRI